MIDRWCHLGLEAFLWAFLSMLKKNNRKTRLNSSLRQIRWNKNTLSIYILTQNTRLIIMQTIKLSHVSHHFAISTRNYARNERAKRAVIRSKLTGWYYLSSYLLPIKNYLSFRSSQGKDTFERKKERKKRKKEIKTERKKKIKNVIRT